MLWETFEQMARELECSVDYLINEAMKQYARQRSYGQRTPYPASRGADSASAGYASSPPPMPPQQHTQQQHTQQQQQQHTQQQMRSSGGMQSRSGGLPPPPARGLPAPPPPPRGMSGMVPPPRIGGGAGALRSQPPTAPRSAPPPIPGGVRSSGSLPPVPGGGFNGGLSTSAALSIIYQGEKHGITKDRFVIGRGKQSSDLTLKDPNVSRQHAMIEYQNGVYFMVDMGSTNGVEYNGQRIARKQIAEGDVFRICDHDLRFTYR
jgi:hypothetical protein